MSKTAQEQRDELMQMVTETRAYQKTIFKKLDKIEEHLATQNGRINNAEKQLSVMRGVGVTISVIFSAVIAFIKGEQ
jgi:chromosome condensin MukBEF ATPase and DNA-binding subunit MukB